MALDVEALDDVLDTYEQLKSDRDTLITDTARLDARLREHELLLTRNSRRLTDFMFTAVYADKITAAAGTTTHGPVFESSQQSKDSQGNTLIPHAFYLLSAHTYTTGRSVVYAGTPISILDLSVYITRSTVATPTRFESKVSIYNVGAQVDVYVRVLKLLGVR